MADFRPPGKSTVAQGVGTTKTLEKTPPGGDSPLQFIVKSDIAISFKAAAIARGMSGKALFLEMFDGYQKDHE